MKTYFVLFSLLLSLQAIASGSPSGKFYSNLKYGEHERNVFDLWTSATVGLISKPKPLVIYIHGGGWVSGSKEEVKKNLSFIKTFNVAGFHYAAINYRFLAHAPLQVIMKEDIAGFVQFIRFHAEKYKINKKRIYVYGASAGGSASLWLASHPDLADPENENPVLRESTRITRAAHINAQVSYDFIQWFSLFGETQTKKFMKQQIWSRYHMHSMEDLYTAEGKEVRHFLDMYGNLSADDAPTLFWNDQVHQVPSPNYNHFVHSPLHAELLHKQAQSVGMKSILKTKSNGKLTESLQATVLNFFGEK